MSARAGYLADVGRPIGEIAASVLNRFGRRQSASIVRRSSVLREALHGFFRATDRRQCALIMKAAKRLEKLTKPQGRKNGVLGYTGIRVLEALLEFVDYRTGRLEPSYLAIAKKAALSISAVADALKRLADAGLCQRRDLPIG